MPRIARIVIPEYPHHIVQRGNRRQKTFFGDRDYEAYLKLLQGHCQKSNLEILVYCLMPNHVHMIAVPGEKNSLADAIGKTHLKYTRMINFRENWRGYLWQGRFSSYVLDERYLLAAVRYILLNPVKAKIVKNSWDYRWSSARHHLGIKKNSFLSNRFIDTLIDDWKEFLKTEVNKDEGDLLRLHERTGRPLGDASFIEQLENKLKISLKKKKPGPKVKEK